MLEIGFILNWIFFAYVSYQVGNKLNIKESYAWYIIPLWNFWILAKNSEIKIKDFSLLAIMIVILFFVLLLGLALLSVSAFTLMDVDSETSLFILNRLAGNMFYTFVRLSIFIIIITVIAIFWGSVARKMGKEYGVYVVLGLFLLYLPPLLLAFERIDTFITTNRLSNMYSPLSEEEKKSLETESSMPKDRLNRFISIGVLVLIFSSIIYSVS